MSHVKDPLTISLIVVSIVIGIELIAIVVFPIFIAQLSNQLSARPKSLYDYCAEEEADDEACDKYLDELAQDDDVFYIDPAAYGDTFLLTYAAIKNGTPISEDNFHYFITLSEKYSDDHPSLPISGGNLPSVYYASSSHKYERSTYAYPYGIDRRISLDIPDEGCAIFDFFPNFQFLYKYSLEEERDCHEFN